MSGLPERVFGLAVRRLGAADVSALPLAYRQGVVFDRVRIGVVDCVVAGTEEPLRLPFAQSLLAALAASGQGEAVLYAPRLTTYQQRRLADNNDAFIIAPETFYLPFLGAASRSRSQPSAPERLSPQAQRLLAGVFDGRWLGLTATELAAQLGRSLPSVSHYLTELAAICPGLVRKQGRVRSLGPVLPEPKGDLLARFEAHLVTPCRQRLDVVLRADEALLFDRGALHAGLSALSSYTDLADDAVTTYVLPGLPDVALFDLAEDPEAAEAVIETWSYEPLAGLNRAADPLSVYAEARVRADAADPRVESALSQLKELITR